MMNDEEQKQFDDYHSLRKYIAKDVGAEPALIYNFIKGWCRHNALNGINYHDGLYWTYNTIQAFNVEFCYMCEKSIRNHLKKLIDKGYIAKGNYNKKGFDRTSWYADLHLCVTKSDNGVTVSDEIGDANENSESLTNSFGKTYRMAESEKAISESQQTSGVQETSNTESLENAHSVKLTEPIPINLTNYYTNELNNNNSTVNEELPFDYLKPKEDLKEKIVGKPTKKEKPIVEDVYFPNNPALDDAFKEYIAYRNEGKYKISARGIKMAVTELKKLAGNDDEYAIAIINQSIIAGYRGLFPAKSYNKNRKVDWETI